PLWLLARAADHDVRVVVVDDSFAHRTDVQLIAHSSVIGSTRAKAESWVAARNISASCVRFRAPSFRMALLMCCFTDFSLRYKVEPISRFEAPVAKIASTSRSRRVRP